MTLPPLPGTALVPAAAALAAALAGRAATRRHPAWRPALAAAALLVGWAVLAGAPRTWWVPRSVVEHLPGAAIAILLAAAAATRLRGRPEAWAGTLGAGTAAWWLATAPAARSESWRVWFAVMALAWLLRRMNAADPRPALALATTLALGLVAANAPLPAVVAALVLLATTLGMLGADAARMPPAALAVALAASAIGSGRVMQGGLAMIDLVCVAAIAAAALRNATARGLQSRLGRPLSEAAAPILLAVAGIACAWVGARAAR